MSSKAVLTGCDLNYLPGAVAMLGSVARHHPEVERFCIVPEAEKTQAEAALGGLAKVITPPRRIPGVIDRLQIAHGKVFASDLSYFEVVAWVDTDIVFCRPAPAIWDVRPGRAVAVRCPDTNRVPHNLPTELRPRFAQLYPVLSAQPGFNGGLFAIRPKDWPDLTSDLHRVLIQMQCENHPVYFDQPLLNVMFGDRVDLLDPTYNWTELYDDPPSARQVRVVHFASKPKPWMTGYPRHEPGYWFWVRHGLAVTDPFRLAAVRARILARTPRRLLGRLWRKYGRPSPVNKG